MQELLDWLEYIEDDRQQRKVRHTLKDILVIVLFATLANADDWVEMALFAESYQDYLRKYIPVFRRSTRKFPSFSSCHFFISFPASRFFLYLQQIFNALLGHDKRMSK